MTFFVLILIAVIFILNGGIGVAPDQADQAVSPHNVTEDYGRKEYRKLDCPHVDRTKAFTEEDRQKCEKWAKKKARKQSNEAYEEAKDDAEEALMEGFRRGSRTGGNPFSHIGDEGGE